MDSRAHFFPITSLYNHLSRPYHLSPLWTNSTGHHHHHVASMMQPPLPKFTSSSFLIENILGLAKTRVNEITSTTNTMIPSPSLSKDPMEPTCTHISGKSLKRPRSDDSDSSLKSSSVASSSSSSSVSKCKRIRTIFTQDQLEKLEVEFEKSQYMVGAERDQLAKSLYLSPNQVKVWFQNRRIKWRKQNHDMTQRILAAHRREGDLSDAGSYSDSEPNSPFEGSFSPKPDLLFSTN